MNTYNDVVKAVMTMAEIFGKTLSPGAARMFVDDLEGYPPDGVLSALRKCRLELARFPTVADIVTRIQSLDGHPGVEEAWAMIPKNEYGSCVWTDEMAMAYGVAHSHIVNGDLVAGRMSFKEVYDRLVKKSRDERKPPHWTPSLGDDRSTHDSALQEAVDKNRIARDHAKRISPPRESAEPSSEGMKSLTSKITRALPSPGET